MPRRKATSPIATPATSKSHKRNLSTNVDTTTSTPGTRASKRLKESTETTPISGKVTPKKSKYFEDPDSEDIDDDQSGEESSASGYESEDQFESESESSASASASESNAVDSEEEAKPKRKGGRQPNKMKHSSPAVGDDLWREGVKTGLGPGKQVFIAKPKPRDDGGIKYVPEKIHPNTMAFLADLKKNNDRDWLKRHDPDYRQSWKDWESFVDALTERISEVDETVPELPPKDLVFRIYRDVRFSSDPTPYKPHFSAAWSRTGRKGPYAAYYVQIQPGGKNFVGGGLWHPEAQPLALIRRNIDRRPETIRSLLVSEAVRKTLLGGVSRDEKKAIKKFCDQNAENALKTKPKGYDADHANIELLRLRNFTIGKRLLDSEILGPEAIEKVMEIITAMHPFVTYLNSVVMPDEHDDDDEDDEDDNDDAGADASEGASMDSQDP